MQKKGCLNNLEILKLQEDNEHLSKRHSNLALIVRQEWKQKRVKRENLVEFKRVKQVRWVVCKPQEQQNSLG